MWRNPTNTSSESQQPLWPTEPHSRKLLGGNSRFTVSSLALSLALNWCVRPANSLLPHNTELRAKETKILQPCLVSACAGCPDGATTGKSEATRAGQMRLCGGLGADRWRRAERRRGDTEQKPDLRLGEAVKGRPTRYQQGFSRNFRKISILKEEPHHWTRQTFQIVIRAGKKIRKGLTVNHNNIYLVPFTEGWEAEGSFTH